LQLLQYAAGILPLKLPALHIVSARCMLQLAESARCIERLLLRLSMLVLVGLLLRLSTLLRLLLQLLLRCSRQGLNRKSFTSLPSVG
jgi:hypothetical protein